MNDVLLNTLFQRLDESAGTYSTLESYYAGTQPLSFLSPDARTALGSRFARMASNLPRLAVTSLAERLRVTGFSGANLWPEWIRNDLDQLAGVAHREALLLGNAFVLVWANDTGAPKVSIESPQQVAVITDPGSRRIVAGIKRWNTPKGTEAVLYQADTITRLHADAPGATTQGFRTVETLRNPLGIPPVVRFRNGDRLLDDGTSEIADLMPLVDGLNKTLADMLVSSEYFARPRRWATGIELEEDGQGNAVNPFPEGHRMLTSEDPASKFGSLPAGDMSGYTAAVNVLLGQIMAVSALPAHYVGMLSGTPASADALRAAEASLSARAESRQQTFGRSWEEVARLMVGVRDGVDPAKVDVRVQWADATTRSVAQEADATVKLFSSGLLPATYALRKLGYSDDEVELIRTARRAEALDTAGTDLAALLS